MTNPIESSSSTGSLARHEGRSIWKRLAALTALTGIAIGIVFGCSTGEQSLPEPGAAPGLGQTSDDPACVDGATRSCATTLGESGEMLTCYEGEQVCVSGGWGPCTDGIVVQRSRMDPRAVAQLRAQDTGVPWELCLTAGSGAAGAAGSSTADLVLNNPCDPRCRIQYQPTGIPNVPITSGTPQADRSTVLSYFNLPPASCSESADCQTNQRCDRPTTDSCEHPTCMTGSALDPACDPCVADICDDSDGDGDANCCASTWDAACVGMVRTVCHAHCPDPADLCAHPLCEQGAGLVDGCDDPTGCVTQVCAADPSCCGGGANDWDAFCVMAVMDICGFFADASAPAPATSPLLPPAVADETRQELATNDAAHGGGTPDVEAARAGIAPLDRDVRSGTDAGTVGSALGAREVPLLDPASYGSLAEYAATIPPSRAAAWTPSTGGAGDPAWAVAEQSYAAITPGAGAINGGWCEYTMYARGDMVIDNVNAWNSGSGATTARVAAGGSVILQNSGARLTLAPNEPLIAGGYVIVKSGARITGSVAAVGAGTIPTGGYVASDGPVQVFNTGSLIARAGGSTLNYAVWAQKLSTYAVRIDGASVTGGVKTSAVANIRAHNGGTYDSTVIDPAAPTPVSGAFSAPPTSVCTGSGTEFPSAPVVYAPGTAKGTVTLPGGNTTFTGPGVYTFQNLTVNSDAILIFPNPGDIANPIHIVICGKLVFNGRVHFPNIATNYPLSVRWWVLSNSTTTGSEAARINAGDSACADCGFFGILSVPNGKAYVGQFIKLYGMVHGYQVETAGVTVIQAPDRDKACDANNCTNGIKDGTETDIDCGNTCAADCANGKGCDSDNDCTSGACCNSLCVASKAAACNDGNSCTTDVCNATAACTFPNLVAGTACNDANACTGTDVCNGSGSCAGSAITCNDSKACTDDSCNTATGCVYTNDNTNACSDSNACTSGDTCNAGACVAGGAVTCTAPSECQTVGACVPASGCPAPVNKANGTACTADANQCTNDTCNAGACTHPNKAAGSACTDGNACTNPDTCNGSGACGAGAAVTCTAPSECRTVGACVPASGCPAPVNKANGTACTDEGNQCTTDSCNAGACSHPNKANGTACNDGSACTNPDTCNTGACSGTAITCNDSKACTDDTCNPATGCVYTNDNSNACTDSKTCTIDSCSAGTCVAAPNNAACNDSKACTDDTCTPATGDAVTGCLFTNDNSNVCTDSNACTNPDSCSGGNCVAGAPVTCTAPTECQTIGACVSGSGCPAPVNKANGTACSADASECTNDVCTAGVCTHPNKANGTACTDEGNQCTTDTCNAGACMHPNKVAGTACTDGNACTSSDTCNGSGSCTAGAAVSCTAPSECQTVGACVPATGCPAPVNRANGTACTPDAAECTDDACNAGACAHPNKAAGVACTDEGNQCTNDTCNGSGACAHPNKAAGTACDDGSACTNPDTCSAGTCSGTGITCNDALPCTDDSCIPATGCVFTNDNTNPCTDSKTCTADACSAGTCVSAPNNGACSDGNACTDDTCTPATGDPLSGCLFTNDNSNVCTDGKTCTVDACVAGTCTPTPNNAACNDGQQCTDDTCTPATGDPVTGCRFTNDDTNACTDADLCTTSEYCSAGSCLSTAVTCDDTKPCTDDSCNPASGCVFANDNTNPCTDTSVCTTDACSAGNCVSAPISCDDTNPCTDNACDPSTGCFYTNDDSNPCSDSNACTTGEHCAAGSCDSTAVTCDDAITCTDDACDTGTGCLYTNDDTNGCTDGDACTTDACAAGVCATAPITCSDSNSCTDDTCEPATGCLYTNDDANACTDNTACTTGDACVAGTCSVTPLTCDDSNPCTDDACDAALGCAFTNDDTNSCADADLCTVEACSAGACAVTPLFCDDGDPCTLDTCDPALGCQATYSAALCGGGVCDYPYPDDSACVPWAIGDTDDKCDGGAPKPDLSLDIPCLTAAGQGVIPVCNHGTVEAPAGLKIHFFDYDSATPLPNWGLDDVTGELAAPSCVTNAVVPPGECIHVPCGDFDGGGDQYLIMINPSTDTGPTVAECNHRDNWSVFLNSSTDGACTGGVTGTSATEAFDEATCGDGQLIQWTYFAWEATTPDDSEIRFALQSCADPTYTDCSAWVELDNDGLPLDGAVPPDPVPAGRGVMAAAAGHNIDSDPSTAPDPEVLGRSRCRFVDAFDPATRCPVVVADLLRAGDPYVRVNVTLIPNSATSEAPVLTSRYLTYSCVDNE